MSIKGVGQEVKVQETQIKPRIEPARVEAQKPTAVTETQTRVHDQAFQSQTLKAALNRAFDKLPANPPTIEPLPQADPPIDYNQVDKQADELIKKHTSDGFFGKDLDEAALGKELADLAKTDPARAAAVADNVFDKIDDGDREGLAENFVRNMTSGELREFAKTDKGREVLGQLKDKINDGIFNDDGALRNRVDSAIKAADLAKTPEFQKLDKTTQQEILSRIEKNEQNAAAVDNLIGLAKDGNFAKLPVDTQKTMLGAFDNRPDDKTFTDALKKLAGKSNFVALSQTDQTKTIDDLNKLAKTESYKGKSGGFLGIGNKTVSDEDKRWMLDNFGNISIYATENPTITSVRNTLDKITSGKVKVELYSEAKDSEGSIGYGYADGDTIHLNTHPDAGDSAEIIDTTVHEVNHILNGHTEAGTPDRFLDEYNAWVIGTETRGTPVDAAKSKEILENLVYSPGGSYDPNGGYTHLHELYNKDEKFRKVIDEVYAGLNQTPPVVTTPEQMRQKLVDAGFESDYLNRTVNSDNR